jgi:2-polyprenyl-3-methyl-5-hydroxy-6-metoxy-1,4-benzoquinol methylase
MTQSYRERIYAHYASKFQDKVGAFNEQEAIHWGRPYGKSYFKGWLPRDLSAPVLEVACGGGRLLHLLKRLGYTDVSGVDLSPEQVALSRQVLPEERVHHEDVIAFLEQHKGQFHLIIGLDIVEHFEKDECLRFLDACREGLGPGGRLVLQTPNAGCFWGAEHRYNDFTHEIGFNPNSLTRILSLVGFEGVVTRELGPVPHGVFSSVRWVLWRILRLKLMLWNLVEIGDSGSGVFTRNFLASGRRAAS